MSKMVSGFAARLLQIKMATRFFVRLCFFIIALQIVCVIAYNAWFNPVWTETKHMVASGLGMAWELICNFKLAGAGKIFANTLNGFWELQSPIYLKSFLVWWLIPLTIFYMIFFDKKENRDREFIQGRQLLTPDELNYLAQNFSRYTLMKTYKLHMCIPLGQVYQPIKEEPKQAVIAGKPGSGKTTLMNHAIKKIRKRSQKLIIHDYKGDYVEKFYDPERGDIIFNPLDIRSIGWCLFNDCVSIMDIEFFSHALIPEATPGTEPYWNNAARDILTGILRYCYVNNKRTNKDIWETAILPNKQLAELLAATKGGEIATKHLTDPEGRLASNLVSIMIQYVKIFEYMAPMKGEFSITEWVTNSSKTGTIFIINYPKLKNTLKPVISLFIQTVGQILLSQRDDLNRRLFFFLDEFGKLPNMATITDLMTAARSKGGAVYIGVQDIGQIDKVYQKDSRTSILNSASNRVVFNCKDRDTAEFFSRDFGQTEYYENTSSKSLSMGEGDRINISQQRRKDPIITPEDIQSLPDLTAYVSIGHHNVALSKWKYLKLKTKAEAFIQRPDLNLETIDDVDPDKFIKGLVTTDVTLPTTPQAKKVEDIEKKEIVIESNMPEQGGF